MSNLVTPMIAQAAQTQNLMGDEFKQSSTSTTAASTAGMSNLFSNDSSAGGFGGLLSTAISQVQGLQSEAEKKVTGLLSGDGTDVHSATLAMERASLGFDLMLQVRNKMVSAYQEIEKLQF